MQGKQYTRLLYTSQIGRDAYTHQNALQTRSPLQTLLPTHPNSKWHDKIDRKSAMSHKPITVDGRQ